MKTKTIAQLEAEIARLSAEKICIETNEGTFGAEECGRAVGTGDPAYGTYRVMVLVAPTADDHPAWRRGPVHVGPPKNVAPGYARRLNTELLAERRQHLADLRRELAALRK